MAEISNAPDLSADWQGTTSRPAWWERQTADTRGRGVQSSSQSGLPLRIGRHGPLPAAATPLRRWQLRIKGVSDPLVALILLVLLAPLLLVIALAIKLTSEGPVLFRQLREGRDGAGFVVFKFRTMYSGACDATGVKQTVAGDGRVTPIGRFLRKTNLDEFPQLLNVLMGQMSLVGPRPHPFNMLAAGRRYDEHVPYYHGRLALKPGITGWAQCNGLRGPTDDSVLATARIDHDLAYVQNYSLALDLRIVLKTIAREAFGGTGL